MQIRTIRKGFESFECKFETFERDSKQSNPNLNHSKGIQIVPMEIGMIEKGFKASESKLKRLQMDLKHSNANSNHSKGIRAFKCKF